MAASAGAWYRVGKVNVTNNNQSVVGVDTNWQSDVIAIAIGDIFTLDAKTWYEVIAVNSDTSITLDRGFEGSTGTNKTYAIVRNTSGTILTRIAGQVSVQFNQKQLFLDELRTWLNSDSASEELTDSHGLKQSLKTPSQMVRDHDEKLAELDAIHPFPYAMRKVEFESKRLGNINYYIASGFVEFGKHWDNSVPNEAINQGLYTHTSIENSLLLGRGSDDTGIMGESNSREPILHIAGSVHHIKYLSENTAGGRNAIRFSPAESGLKTYNSESGIQTTHSSQAIAFASETDSERVVIRRTDMWGIEGFRRKITDSDPFVYPHGLIQSKSLTMNGLPTEVNSTRPSSYFSWYAGDTESTGRGINWILASESEKIKLCSDPKNSIFYDDEEGAFFQDCLRGRSFAGLGNGYWGNIDSSVDGGGSTLGFGGQSFSVISPQGNRDSVENNRANGRYHDYSWIKSQGHPFPGAKGNFVATRSTGVYGSPYTEVAIEGRCYFIVCGTVNRLNQGAYHPSLNPLGAAKSMNNVPNQQSYKFWKDSGIKPLESTADCFDFGLYDSTDGKARLDSGSINDGTTSGRPDGRFFDVIYASGFGGVIEDLRFSAKAVSHSNINSALMTINNGRYRGTEFLPYNGFEVNLSTVNASGTVAYIDGGTVHYKGINGESLALKTSPAYGGGLSALNMFLVRQSDNALFKLTRWNNEFHSKLMQWTGSGYSECSGSASEYNTKYRAYLFHGKFPASEYPSNNYFYSGSNDNWNGYYFSQFNPVLPMSDVLLGGRFLNIDVISSPENLGLVSDLNQGFLGNYLASIPDGAGTKIKVSRPVRASNFDVTFYLRDGLWDETLSAHNTNEPLNTVGHPTVFALNSTALYMYETNSAMVDDVTVPAVSNKDHLLGLVFATDTYDSRAGRDIAYSLTRIVPTSNVNKNKAVSFRMSTIAVFPESSTLDGNGNNSHTELPLLSPNPVDSPAVKFMPFTSEISGMLHLCFSFTELGYDSSSSSWGDDGNMLIASKTKYKLDDNSKVRSYGAKITSIPIGWV